ncbi:hypothetical protein QAD02_009715 [Eretmocerus hayati]|uniref:Uncharacterized protein n=1 Tax=Eretmocerus hayati TaxID=131215 RepID=A0ACC2NCH9_9HYME|nr:hypothetical protein QAD02_009715 [Eretmocerus hayati]
MIKVTTNAIDEFQSRLPYKKPETVNMDEYEYGIIDSKKLSHQNFISDCAKHFSESNIMNQVLDQVRLISVLVVLLSIFATHGETNELIERKLEVNYTGIGPPKSFASPLFADKSFMYTICNFWWGISCQVHVVKFDGPEEVHSFKYGRSPGRSINAIFHPNFVRNGFFLLTKEVDLYSETYEDISEYVSGIVFNPKLDNLFKLDLPSDLQFNQHFIGSVVKSDELVVVLGNHTICGKFNRCMLRFNNEGQKIGEPIVFPIQYDKLQLLSGQEGSVNEGLFGIGTIVERDSSFSQVFYVTANNEPIIIDTINYPNIDFAFWNTRDMYEVCEYRIRDDKNGTIQYNCLQYDWKLNKTTHLNINTTFGQTGGSMLVSIKKLNTNSFLFTSLECNNGQKEFNCSTVQISVINSYDQILRSKEILTDLECHDISSISSGIAEINDEYCFYLSCLDAVQYPAQSYLHGGHLYVKCLPISDI